MTSDAARPEEQPAAELNEAANLLEGLEALRAELGSVADELIVLLREAGVTTPDTDPDTPLG